jgi:integrase
MSAEEKAWRKQHRVEIERQLQPLLIKALKRGSYKTRESLLTGALVFCSWKRRLPNDIAEEVKKSGDPNYVYKMLDEYATYLSSCKICGQVAADVDTGKHLKETGHRPKVLSPNSIKDYMSVAKKILSYFDVEISKEKFREKVVLPRSHTITEDEAPKTEEVKKVLLHCDIRGKALITMLASSGMRVGELLNLRVKDVDFSHHPTLINIRAEITKDKQARYVFISDEATEFLKEWLGDRINNPDDYIFYSGYFSVKGFKERKRRNEPMSYWNADAIFTNALKRAGLYKKDEHGRDKIHLHCLRKFFFTRMLPILGRDITEALMGHKLFLDYSYRRYTREEMAEFYKKGMKAVTILTPPPEVSREEVEKMMELTKFGSYLDFAYFIGLAGEDLINKATEEMRKKKTVDEKIEYLKEVCRKILAHRYEINYSAPHNSSNNKKQKVVDEKELERYLEEGWEVVATLPSGKIVIKES